MGTEKFCLRWNDFESNISGAFRELRDDKDFFDVTLACDDEQIQAHKVILSACSPFFRNVLRRNPHQHPLLYLKGVKFTDLQSVLNFMYHGEVNVAQEELNSFLSVAEDLRVKGLTQNNQSGGATSSSTPSFKSTNEPLNAPRPGISSIAKPRPSLSSPIPTQSPQAKRPRQSVAPLAEEDDDIQEVVPVKTEPREVVVQSNNGQMNSSSHAALQPVPQAGEEEGALQHYVGEEGGYDDYGQYGDQGYEGAEQAMAAVDGNKGLTLDELSDKYLARFSPGLESPSGHSLSCLLCYKTFHDRTSGKFHLEARHFPSDGHFCTICGKHLKTQNSLKCHTYQTHTKEERDAAKRLNSMKTIRSID